MPLRKLQKEKTLDCHYPCLFLIVSWEFLHFLGESASCLAHKLSSSLAFMKYEKSPRYTVDRQSCVLDPMLVLSVLDSKTGALPVHLR